MPQPPLAGDLSDPESPSLPQGLDESSSRPQEHSLVYHVWLDTLILNPALATNSLFNWLRLVGRVIVLISMLQSGGGGGDASGIAATAVEWRWNSGDGSGIAATAME